MAAAVGRSAKVSLFNIHMLGTPTVYRVELKPRCYTVVAQAFGIGRANRFIRRPAPKVDQILLCERLKATLFVR